MCFAMQGKGWAGPEGSLSPPSAHLRCSPLPRYLARVGLGGLVSLGLRVDGASAQNGLHVYFFARIRKALQGLQGLQGFAPHSNLQFYMNSKCQGRLGFFAANALVPSLLLFHA